MQLCHAPSSGRCGGGVAAGSSRSSSRTSTSTTTSRSSSSRQSGRARSVAAAASRRDGLAATAAALLLQTAAPFAAQPAAAEGANVMSTYQPMEALRGKDYGKARMTYPDFTLTPSGLQYKDLRDGSGETPKEGDTLVVDWEGYTIGYYGRPFEARNKAKGGSFTGDDKDFLRFTLGKHEVIPAFEEAAAGMKVGGIRRLVVPVELGYPGNDYKKQGPKPTSYSGQRALLFVLQNQGLIDKTLLFDIELVRLQK